MQTYAIRALRWQVLLEPVGPTRFRTAFRTTIIGFAALFLLPARLGEVLRPYLLARQDGLKATSAFAIWMEPVARLSDPSQSDGATLPASTFSSWVPSLNK